MSVGTDKKGDTVVKSRREKRWLRIEVGCEDDDILETVAAEVALRFSKAVQLEGSGLVFYLDRCSNEHKGWRERAWQRMIEEVSQHRCKITRVVEIADEDWARQWKKHFKPIRVGRRLWIAPSWEPWDQPPDERIIRIDPGRAFGTGHHETTRLCIEWLEDWADDHGPPSPGSLLDVGTGTGILSITAACLGFEPILGIDIDAQAVQIACENRERNEFASLVEFRAGSVEALGRTFRVVIANIQADPLVAMAEGLSRCVETPGRLALSGILTEQMDTVVDAFEKVEMRCVGRRRAGEWCLLEFIRT